MTELRGIEDRSLDKPAFGDLDPGQDALSRLAAELQALRGDIDALDGKILALLGARRRLVVRIAAIKSALGLAPVSPRREAALLAALAARAQLHGLDADFVRKLFQAVIRSSCPLPRDSAP